MVYRGHVKGGVVVFETETPPEGAEVKVEVLPASNPQPTIWDKLQKYSGAVKDLPTDMARNHDHYIHGSPKR